MTYLNQHNESKQSQQIVSMLSDGKDVNEVAESIGMSRNEFLEQQIAKYALHAVTYSDD